jgi:hypothetical protein
MTTEEAIKGLAEEAQKIGQQHQAQASAWEQQLQAQAVLLDAVLGAIWPALPAICSRVELKRQAGIGTPAPWKGVRVGGSLTDGRALYLNEHGALVDLNYTLKGNGNEWSAAWCPITTRHTVTEWNVADIIENLTRAMMQQQKGGWAERTAIMQSRAAQLQVVASMLRGMK